MSKRHSPSVFSSPEKEENPYKKTRGNSDSTDDVENRKSSSDSAVHDEPSDNNNNNSTMCDNSTSIPPNIAESVADTEYTIPDEERWDFCKLYMSLAVNCAYRSEEPVTKVGCVITDGELCMNAIGYNGYHKNQSRAPVSSGVSKQASPTSPSATSKHYRFELPYGEVLIKARVRTRQEKDHDRREHYSVHAEMNAILHSNAPKLSHRGGWIFVTLIPCPVCSKHLMQLGFKNIVYLDDNGKYLDSWKHAKSGSVSLIPYSLLQSVEESLQMENKMPTQTSNDENDKPKRCLKKLVTGTLHKGKIEDYLKEKKIAVSVMDDNQQHVYDEILFFVDDDKLSELKTQLKIKK